MKLRLTPSAANDFEAILDFLDDVSPAGARNVKADIDAALSRLMLFPRVGKSQSRGRIRRLVTARYAYLLYYVLDVGNDEIVVLNIKHSARARDKRFED